ncbi:integrase, catalytic region, zinc finger, CCHC-type containing protein [Tanacetum coccineum]|uniref:Integrase, catalytic region, zinc finger, CCHC-type containing protein n=1 Tax=Tanacetum coccineum TaxID=301880 RepID=A0ABQ4XY40_9ASTR
MVNTSLKKLKYHLAGFDVVVKERTTPTTITEGSWGFEHTKYCFRDEINPFVKDLKDLFDTFDQYLIDELFEVQNVFHQMEQAMEQHRVESKTFEEGVKAYAEMKHLNRPIKPLLLFDKPARKLKGKVLVHNDVTKHPSDPEMLKIDVEPITPKLLNKKTAHSAYIKHTQEEATVLRDLVEHVKSKYPLDHSLESACRVKLSTSASGSQPSDKTKKDKIWQTPSSTQKNKHSKLNANSELKCVKCNGYMLSDNHDLYVLDFINNVNARKQSKSVKKSSKIKVWKPTGKVFTNIGCIWRPTGRTFTIVGNACPLTRSTTTTEVTLRKPTALENETPKPVLTSVSANKKEPSQSWGSIVSNVPSSSLDDCRSSKLFSIKFKNDHMAKIIRYGDYQIRNVTISRVYYVEGLGHNLFSIGQFCDSNPEVAFRQHTCFIHHLEGVDLLTGSRGNNLYTLSLGDMMVSSLICLLSKASKTKSWLWHRHLSHLNFAARTMLIYAKALLFLWPEAVATACYTQNRSIVRLCHGKTPYELLHDKPPDLSFSMYPVHSAIRQTIVRTWVSENLGKLQLKADIGIFIGYAPTKKVFRIYNRRTRRIIETIHVDFDELIAMASEHSSSGPALHMK